MEKLNKTKSVESTVARSSTKANMTEERKRLVYVSVWYERMKKFMEHNRHWFEGEMRDRWCKSYDPSDECACPVCWEGRCDGLKYESPQECAALSRELLENFREGNTWDG